METGPDLRAMEEELARAVVVSVVGSRRLADLAAVAAVIVEEFELAPLDMSIRAFDPEDFLVLCRSVEIRNRMVRRGRAGTPQFDLMLSPWSRRAGATAITMPVLVPLALRGVSANAWTRRTTDTLFHGLGIVVKVAATTEARNDMSGFRVWLRTDDTARIPSRRILVVEEPDKRGARALEVVDAPDALWYPISIVQEDGAVRLGPQVDAPPPPPSPPSEGRDRDGLGSGGLREAVALLRQGFRLVVRLRTAARRRQPRRRDRRQSRGVKEKFKLVSWMVIKGNLAVWVRGWMTRPAQSWGQVRQRRSARRVQLVRWRPALWEFGLLAGNRVWWRV
nr:uncharacterized protein LOC120976662 [Aegilops tauschii subsp. strangulata]